MSTAGRRATGGVVPSVGRMITATHLTKRHGSATAVDDVSFTAADGSVTGGAGDDRVRVRTADVDRLELVLRPLGGVVARTGDDTADVTGLDAGVIAGHAGTAGLVLTAITPVQASLEDAFFALAHDQVEYRGRC